MDVNRFNTLNAINWDRPNWMAHVAAIGLTGADLSREEWFDHWLNYAMPYDGSTPTDVMNAEPVDEFEDSRDAAGR